MNKLYFSNRQKEASLAEGSVFNHNELIGIFAAANEASSVFNFVKEPAKIVSRLLQGIEDLESFDSWSKLYDYDHDSLVSKMKSLTDDEAHELLIRIGLYWQSEDDYQCFVQAATEDGGGKLYLAYTSWLALDKNLLKEVLNDNGITTRTFYLVGWDVVVEQPGAGTQFIELSI